MLDMDDLAINLLSNEVSPKPNVLRPLMLHRVVSHGNG